MKGGDTCGLRTPQQETEFSSLLSGNFSFSYSSQDSWVCRAYCLGEKDALYANGAISVHQSLANKSPFINDIAKGRALARVVPTYGEVRDRFGLSHVELSFEGQCVSRADMFLVSEALRDHILYEGQEVAACGFIMRVNEMLCTVRPAIPDGASTGATQQGDGNKQNRAAMDGDGAHKTTKMSDSQRSTPSNAAIPTQQPNQEGEMESRYRRVQCGIVTDTTLVNFFSLSPEHFIILEISKEMWNPTEDGRIKLSWALKNFLGEYLVQQVHKHKASPLIRIVMVGRLHPLYAIKGQVDILHMMKIPRDYRLASVVEEVELQCKVLLGRVLQEIKQTFRHKRTSVTVPLATGRASLDENTGRLDRNTPAASSASSASLVDALTEEDIFVHAKNSCTIETINLVLEQYGKCHADRNTGYTISVISAGKGLYQVTNDLMQATCTRLFNVGIEKVNIVCIGRPPLHATPLLEYVLENEEFQPQNHLHVDQRGRRFYEKPEWARCFFYYPVQDVTLGGALSFELLTKEDWQQRHRSLWGSSSGIVSDLDLTMAPLSSVVLPVMEPNKVGHVCSAATKTVNGDPRLFPAFPLVSAGAPETSGSAKHTIPFADFFDVQATTTHPAVRASATSSSEEEGRPKGEVSCAVGRSETTAVNGIAKTCVASRQCPSFVCATWYFLHGGVEGSRYQRLGRHGVHDLIEHQSYFTDGSTGHGCVSLDATGIVPCGLNIFDSDVRSGYMLLELRINQSVFPGASWSSHILSNTDMWSLLMGAFSDRDNCLSSEEQSYFVSKFSAAEIFSRKFSAILSGGQSLILASRRSDVTFLTSREIVFSFRRALFMSIDDAAPLPPPAKVAYVRIRNNSLFAIKTISPYCKTAGTEVLSATSRNVTTDVLLRRRWQFAHPEMVSSPTQRSLWAALCRCRILPIYGTKSAYPPLSFFSASTHQYAVSINNDMDVLEYVLQRLHQQYQIVVVGSSLAGMQWPRERPTQNAHLEMSICHQVHELKISETGQSISVRRMLHREMYSNAPETHMITHSYLLLNYLKSDFSVRRVNLETQIGKKRAFCWESVDAYIRERRRPDVFIPYSQQQSPFGDELCIALLPDAFETSPLSFQEFENFINNRFSAHLTARGRPVLRESVSELTTNIPDKMDSPDTLPLRTVTLYHDNPLSLNTHFALDHVTGRTLSLETPFKNRWMSVDILLPETYNPKCHFVLKISWLVCNALLITDWMRSISAHAMRCRLRAVPIPSYSPSSSHSFFMPRYTVRVDRSEKEPCFRRRLLSLLTSSTYRYYPDVPVMSRNCRLLHFSGLCCVTSEPDGVVVARWFENPMVRTGQPEHQQLLHEFTQAVQRVRDEMTSSGGG